MAAGPEALKQLLKDIEELDVWWHRIRETMIEQGFIDEDHAWQPDWAPWEQRFKDAIWQRIDNWPKK